MRPAERQGTTLPLVGTGQFKDIRNLRCSRKFGLVIPRMHKGAFSFRSEKDDAVHRAVTHN
jgi:hypothetical protein